MLKILITFEISFNRLKIKNSYLWTLLGHVKIWNSFYTQEFLVFNEILNFWTFYIKFSKFHLFFKFTPYHSGEPFLGLDAVIHWPGFEPPSEENGNEHKQHFMFRTVTMLIGQDIKKTRVFSLYWCFSRFKKFNLKLPFWVH